MTSITAAELNSAIKDNGEKVVVSFNGETFRVRPSSAAQDEADFTVPGIRGNFKVHEIGRDVEEPGQYNYIYSFGPQFFALFGDYDSWSGTDLWDNEFVQVEPKVINHTVWRAKK